MADTGHRAELTTAGRRSRPMPGSSGWGAWVVFGAVMMILVGTLHGISGLVALFEDDYYAVRPSGLVISVDYIAWGWTHLLLGVLVVLAGCGVIAGQTWARAVGVVFAVISALVNMLFVTAYPLWSVIIITLDVVVIYALIVHGRELKEA
jgi:hypothetical protein